MHMHLQNDHQGRPCRQFIIAKIKSKFFCTIKFSTASAYPIDAKKKFMWDDKNRRAYEIQTSARNDSLLGNADKKQKYNIPITWVTYDESILEEIKKITENKDEYLLIKM